MSDFNWKGHRLAYTDEGGKGTAVILLHGFCESRLLWDDWKEDLQEEGLRVIAVDLPGFGDSTLGNDPMNLADMAEAVVALAKSLKLKGSVCVGHSMGGYVCLEIAARHPDLLLGIGLFHSHPYADTEAQRAARQKSIDFIRRNGHIYYVKQLIPRLFASRTGTSASFRRDMIILRASRSGPEGILNALHAMRDRPSHAKTLSDYQRPVLFVNGLRDPIYTDDQRRDQLALPAVSEVVTLQRAGHMGMIEEKEVTQRAVRRFVRFCAGWA